MPRTSSSSTGGKCILLRNKLRLTGRTYDSEATKVLLSNGRPAAIGSLKVGTKLLGPDGHPRTVLQVHHARQVVRRIAPQISRHVSPLSMPPLLLSDDCDLAILYQPTGHTTLTTAQSVGGDWAEIRQRLAGLVGLEELPPVDPREFNDPERWDAQAQVPISSHRAPGQRNFRQALAEALSYLVAIPRGKTGASRLKSALNSCKYMLVGARFYVINVRNALRKQQLQGSAPDGSDEEEAAVGPASSDIEDESDIEVPGNIGDIGEQDGEGNDEGQTGAAELPVRTAHVYFSWSTGVTAKSWGCETRYFGDQQAA